MEPPSTPDVRVLTQDLSAVSHRKIADAIRKVLIHRGFQSVSVNVQFVDDAHMRELNRQFRRIDSTTDVLTFDWDDAWSPPLGEIAISVETAQRQAELRGVSPEDELVFLAIHGALHLCGLDDDTDAQRAEMQAEMASFARELGLPEEPNWLSLAYAEATK
jgi:probable rRNA maturation factor